MTNKKEATWHYRLQRCSGPILGYKSAKTVEAEEDCDYDCYDYHHYDDNDDDDDYYYY